MERKILWQADERYVNKRIPGLYLSDSGTLLAVCEARREWGDWSKMDVLLIRSTDGGATFSDPIVLASGTENHPTVNNPIMMQDKSHILHFLYCEDYAVEGGRVLHRTSADDGITWGEAVDITPSAMPTYRNAFALGPGHGICTQRGDLVVPVWMVPKHFNSPVREHFPSVIATLYSNDCGKSWAIGEILPASEHTPSPNETEIAQLSDGRVYLNCRLGGRRGCRGRAYSKTGYGGWYGYEPDPALTDPECFGSIVVAQTQKGAALLFANCNHASERKNVTVKGSKDGGKTWQTLLVVDEDRGGYVEMQADDERRQLYLLYEEEWGVRQWLVTLPYDELLRDFC